jgi:uncharacterized protein (DUF2235 family)
MKRLIVCSDGTWNTRDRGRPTNVEKIAQAILPTAPDGTPQVVFYDQGVGTSLLLDQYLGGAFGIGLAKNVEDAYRFLVDNYTDGDEIFLFGFSRGAFTVRSTAGLIRKCDLLTKANSHRFGEAYALYRKRSDEVDGLEAVRFRSRYSSPVRVKCIGVWDTVGALGIPGHIGSTTLGHWINRDFQFHDVKISSKVVMAGYQALAIDEHRGPFRPAIWWREHLADQVLEQAWFPGTHSDVGGGSLTWDEAARQGSLADVALEWMAQRAKRHGLVVDETYLDEHLFPNPLAPIHPSRTGIYRFAEELLRPIFQLPDDLALHLAIADRRREFPRDDPVQHPPPLESPQEIHESARIRVDQDRSYRPINLMLHFDK